MTFFINIQKRTQFELLASAVASKFTNNTQKYATECHFRFYESWSKFTTKNNFLLILKYYVYDARENRRLDLKLLKRNIDKGRITGKEISIKESWKKRKIWKMKENGLNTK